MSHEKRQGKSQRRSTAIVQRVFLASAVALGFAELGFAPANAQSSTADAPVSCVHPDFFSDGRLEITAGQTCVMPSERSYVPTELSSLRMEDNSKVILQNTGTDENTWEIQVERAWVGHNVVIDARGTRGADGHNGAGHRRVRPSSCRDGANGNAGGTGFLGHSAQNVVLGIAFEFLGSMTIDATGGAGGNGGRGSVGQGGGYANVNRFCSGGTGGRGGTGGTGGHGGAGGDITVNLDLTLGVPLPLIEQLDLKFEGGEGGGGGQGGRGGPGGREDCGAFHCEDAGRRGGPGRAGEAGENGEQGSLSVVVDSAYWAGGDVGGDAAPLERELQGACKAVFASFPRFLSLADGYLIGPNVREYVMSSLEAVSSVYERNQNVAIEVLAADAYRGIRRELRIIDQAVRNRYSAYARDLAEAARTANNEDTLEEILADAGTTGCLGGVESSEFDQCRNRCLQERRVRRTTSRQSGSSERSEEGNSASDRWERQDSSDEEVETGTTQGCVTGCMDILRESRVYEACSKVVDRIFALRRLGEEVELTAPTLSLSDIIQSRMIAPGTTAEWTGPLLLGQEDTFWTCPSVITSGQMDAEHCGTAIGPIRWRQRYACDGRAVSNETEGLDAGLPR